MDEVIKVISSIPGIYHVQGASDKLIEEAQRKLNTKFNAVFTAYLKHFGAVSFGSHEIMGLNVAEYLNVVDNTLNECKNDARFPAGFYVIENIGIEGVLIISNELGEIFEYQFGEKKKIADNFIDYLKSLLK